ncbi:MFS transporter [Streptomyces cucumeris]|uniref:MFS transporter n=1 Tax=Streptomyces cucumeris TaxID=2962890 RepID=UPI0020C85389|nr:MFS transporter [Streptomyces sp. NEAU-Y11]MCP9210262.1 MFS transporter [Streptomyces sp. NEAU-Y11]
MGSAPSPTHTGPSSATFLDRIGIPRPLAWGFLGLLLFMIGDGVESGYLSPFLVRGGLSTQQVAVLLSAYGITAAVAAWSSGALSELWGPRRVMWAGLGIWAVCEVLFLVFGVMTFSYPVMVAAYMLRGFGYPLFAFGFLVWITTATPRRRLGTAVGWFWFAFTGGLPTLGSLFAKATIPVVGEYLTLWLSLVLVLAGGLLTLLCVREPHGDLRVAEGRPVATLLKSVTIIWQQPKIGIGGVVRAINTAPEFGFLVFLPLFFTDTVGLSMSSWLTVLSAMFMSNIVWNLLFGVIGDRLGWRRTIAYCGGLGCAASTLLLYYVPLAAGAEVWVAVAVGVVYGATLAGYVPLSALMPSLSPEHKGAAMSVLNLGAGLSTFIGPAVVGLAIGPLGVGGVMWIFAGLYVVSAVLTLFLRLPDDDPAATAGKAGAEVTDPAPSSLVSAAGPSDAPGSR